MNKLKTFLNDHKTPIVVGVTATAATLTAVAYHAINKRDWYVLGVDKDLDGEFVFVSEDERALIGEYRTTAL